MTDKIKHYFFAHPVLFLILVLSISTFFFFSFYKIGGEPVVVTAAPLYATRVNSGGNDYVDTTGVLWVRDRVYNAIDGFGYQNARAYSSASAIANTEDDVLYQNYRYGGSLRYRFDVPNGSYNVRLKFAEIAPALFGVGRRVFNVALEGTTVLSNFDVYAEAGANTALDKAFPVVVNDGSLIIQFSTITGRAMVSAVEVTSVAQSSPDFSLSVSPSSQSLAPSSATDYTVEVAYLNGFSPPQVDLWVTGLPAGVTGTFNPTPLTHEGRALLTVQSDATVTPSTSTLTIGATAEGITHTQNVTLVTSTQPDFALDIVPASQDVPRGGSRNYQVTVNALNGFASPVTLSIAGLPAGASGSFSPNPVTPTAATTVTVSADSTTPLGSSAFTVTGASGSLYHSVQGTAIITQPGAGWGISVVGSTGAANNSAIVGPGRNDGVSRVYVGTVTTGGVIEFSWNGSAWGTPVRVGGAPSNGGEIHNLNMGPGRNDGVVRIYACHNGGPLYELSHQGGQWTQATIGSPNGSCYHTVVGDGRNDGVQRLYAGRGNGLFEYTWNVSGWDTQQIGSVPTGVVHGVALGSGRGGSEKHVYAASTSTGTYEATFADGIWSMTSMGDSGDVRNVSVGAGRNDGIMRVYNSSSTGLIREFSWVNNAWTSTAINTSPGTVLVHAYVVNGRNDGVLRVYASGGNGSAYEYTWTGSSWSALTLGGGQNYMYGFYFGDGRNDGRIRLYGASFSQEVYEYTWQ